MVEVVSAVVIRAGRILLTQRRPDQDFPLCWETPGGKVDGLHESHHDALRRELREEVGVEVRLFEETAPPSWKGAPVISQQALWCGKIARPRGDEVFALLYETDIVGEPRPMEGQGIGWFTEGEMRGLRLTPSNESAFGLVAARMRRSAS